MTEFVGDNWIAVCGAVTVALSTLLVRLLELYGKEASTIAKLGRFVLSLASLWTAKGGNPRGVTLGNLQVPGLSWSEPERAAAEREAKRRGINNLTKLMVIGMLSTGGCGGTLAALNGAQATALSAEKVLMSHCGDVPALVEQCAAAGDRECAPMQRCKRAAQAIRSVHVGYVIGAAAVQVGDDPSAEKALAEVRKLIPVIAKAIEAWRK